MPKWIFFDVGWTLVDETRAHLRRFDAVCAAAPAAAGLSAQDLFGVYAAAVTARAADPFALVLESVGLSASDRKLFPFDHGATRLYRDAGPVLRVLHGSVRLGILANQSAGLGNRLAGWGIRHLFDLVLESETEGARKPEPRFFELAAERAGCAPGELLMVGDRLDNDIAPAKRAGWRTIRVRRGLHDECEPLDPDERADAVVASLEQLALRYVPADRLRLAEMLDLNGAIIAWPERPGDKRLILEYLATRFAHGREYTEAEVNAIILTHHLFGDYALLRRELIVRGLLTRDAFGHRYRRTDR